MKTFILSLALFAGEALCAGGGGSGASVLTKTLNYTDPATAPVRLEEIFSLINNNTVTNTKPKDNTLDMKVWLKNNDDNRALQEMYGRLDLTIKPKPAKDENINVGFYFGKKVQDKKTDEYLKPTSFEGSFATVGFKTADPTKSSYTSTMVAFEKDPYDTYTQPVSKMPTKTPS